MKILAVTLSNIRQFTDPVRIDGIGDGVNVLCEPNEHGKSTLFDAIHAVFFKASGSADRQIKSLRPHGGGAPEVTIDIETPEGTFTIAKRWLKQPAATVHRAGRLIAQADHAEAWIGERLGGGGGGPSGLIWVRQGTQGFRQGTPREQEAALEARRDLMSSVGEEVQAMTGGRRMDQVLARCQGDLATYATGRNRSPKRGGPWKTAEDLVAALEAEHRELADTAEGLQSALAERKQAARALREIEAPEAAAARQERLVDAEAAHQAAERHAEALRDEARKVEIARNAVAAAGGELDRFRAAHAERTEASRLLAEAEDLAASEREAESAARGIREAAQAVHQAAREARKLAEDARRHAERAAAARDGADRRRDLAAQIEKAERARSEFETAAAASRTGPDRSALYRIESCVAARKMAKSMQEAAAAQVIARYLPGAEGKILDGDTPLGEADPRPLTRPLRLTIDGIGALEFRPAERGDDTSVEAAEDALRKALDEIGAETVEAARAAGMRRQNAERSRDGAEALLRGLAPSGIEPLREALARIPELEAEDEALDLPEAETRLGAARAEDERTHVALEAATRRHEETRLAMTRAEAVLDALRGRIARAEEAARAFGGNTEETLTAELVRAKGHLRSAEAILSEMTGSAPDPEATAAALARAASVDRKAREEIARLRPLLATLEERIARTAGEMAVEERLAETDQKLTAAREDLARIERHVAVLTRLETALVTARQDARERYFAPVAAELRPLLQLLWPGGDLTWGQETLLPDALVRDGLEEPIDILSGGTQEQIALLVRLAFARMLAKSGRRVPVIFDDALVFTDDDRIERMFDALHRQAGDLQIIVLTCRQRAFRELGGRTLRIAPAPDGDASSG